MSTSKHMWIFVYANNIPNTFDAAGKCAPLRTHEFQAALERSLQNKPIMCKRKHKLHAYVYHHRTRWKRAELEMIYGYIS